MSCALVPVPKTSTFLPRQAAPSLKPLECTTWPAKRSSVGISGMFGVPLTLVAMTMWRGRMTRPRHRPAAAARSSAGRGIVAGALEAVRVQKSISMTST